MESMDNVMNQHSEQNATCIQFLYNVLTSSATKSSRTFRRDRSKQRVKSPPYDLLLSNELYTQFWSSSRAKRAGLYTTPASALSFASLRCRSSKNLLFSVAKSMLLLANPSVTFCHILRDSVGSWLGTVCTNLGCFLHVPASNITSLLPVCCVLMFIFPFQSPSNEYTLFFWFGANT